MMPTVFPSHPKDLSVEAPRLDLTSNDSARRLIFRLKDNNRALEDLRAALDDGEVVSIPHAEPDVGRV